MHSQHENVRGAKGTWQKCKRICFPLFEKSLKKIIVNFVWIRNPKCLICFKTISKKMVVVLRVRLPKGWWKIIWLTFSDSLDSFEKVPSPTGVNCLRTVNTTEILDYLTPKDEPNTRRYPAISVSRCPKDLSLVSCIPNVSIYSRAHRFRSFYPDSTTLSAATSVKPAPKRKAASFLLAPTAAKDFWMIGRKNIPHFSPELKLVFRINSFESTKSKILDSPIGKLWEIDLATSN